MKHAPRRVFATAIASAGAVFMLSCSGCPGATPTPPDALSCALDGITLPTADGSRVRVRRATTSGVITGDTVTLLQYDTLRVTGDLTIVAYHDLVIEGGILLPAGTDGRPSPNITLVSLNGTVYIRWMAFVGGGKAASGAAGGAGGKDGADGGTIKLIAMTQWIGIEGKVVGQAGGDGGAADEDASSYTVQNSANAVGGRAGRGGSVTLCSRESVSIFREAKLVAGDGGAGGSATARSDHGRNSAASSGRGGDGGDVVFISTGSTTTLTVSASDSVRAGKGGNSGHAVATFARPVNDATVGLMTATADTAGSGGTIRFLPLVAYAGTSVLQAGDGGTGGTATATASAGWDGGFVATAGGNATATGGTGGAGGAMPSLSPGTSGANGGGGAATATPGRGGNGPSGIPGLSGAPSGVGIAQGGANGGSSSPGVPLTIGPAPPRGLNVGGILTPPGVTQPGAP